MSHVRVEQKIQASRMFGTSFRKGGTDAKQFHLIILEQKNNQNVTSIYINTGFDQRTQMEILELDQFNNRVRTLANTFPLLSPIFNICFQAHRNPRYTKLNIQTTTD